MKEETYSIIYSTFYELLRKKFFTEKVTSPVKQESKDIWEENNKETKENIACDLFKITNPFYFHRKYDEEAKQHMAVGYPLYPITVDRRPMAHALKFLLLGEKLELIEKYPSITIKIYEAMDWETQYDTLLDFLIKDNFPDGIEAAADEIRKNHGIGHVDEEKLLSIIVSNRNFFSPILFQNIIRNYFEYLSQKNYLAAWQTLSPQFQKNSIWDGSFELFSRTYKNVSSIRIKEPILFSNFSFRYLAAEGIISYIEEGVVSNVPWILCEADEKIKDKIMNGDNKLLNKLSAQKKILRNYLIKFRLKQLHHYWLKATLALDLSKMTPHDLLNADFHKVFSLFHFTGLELKAYKDMKNYKANFTSRITFMYINKNWVINSIYSNSLLNIE